jgi:hypothetical protein
MGQDTPDKYRPLVNSYDVFDTLITRRCLDPKIIFAQVEKQERVEGFARSRIEAEVSLAGKSYNFDEIYLELARQKGWSPQMCGSLKRAEIDAECANAIPIVDNLSKVKDGDLLVSDMYLDIKTIRRLLEQCGLRRNVGLYVSANGKATGDLWPRLLQRFAIARHTGDNIQNDKIGPEKYGIRCQLDRVSSLLETEVWLIRNDLPEVALLCREARLNTRANNHISRELMNLQTSLNCPMLLLASVRLMKLICKNGLKKVLFSSRDGELWMKIFRRLAEIVGANIETEYFYTSRLARTSPSNDYLRYAKACLSENTMLLDLCGTGWSVEHLVKNIGMNGCPVFLFSRYPRIDEYEKLAPTPRQCEFHSIIGPDERFNGGVFLEMLNSAPYGSAVDVCYVDGIPMPILDEDRRPDSLIAYIKNQHEAAAQFVTAMDQNGIGEIMRLDEGAVNRLASSLARHAAAQGLLLSVFLANSIGEDKEVCERLGCPGVYAKG